MRTFLLVAALALVGACQDAATPPVSATSTPADTADQFMVGVSFFLHDGGLRRARVLADTAYFYNDHRNLDLRGVSAEFFTSTGASDSRMTAERAFVDTRSQAMEAYGSVVLTSVEGRVVRSEHLSYDRSRNEIRSDSAFVATDPDGSLMEGIGFTTTPGLTSIKVHQGKRIRGAAVQIPRG